MDTVKFRKEVPEEPVKCRRCGKPITGYAYYGPKGAECEECWHIVDTYVPTGKPCIKKRN